MREFETYFSSDAIVSYLCKLRAKIANSRNKKHLVHVLTASDKFNYHAKEKCLEAQAGEANGYVKYQCRLLNQLRQILPPRKKWVVLGGNSRTNQTTKQPLSSTDRNYYSLIKTIKSYRIKAPEEPWLVALDEFIKDIQDSVASGTYKITSPTIYPKLKTKKQLRGENECRPICLFDLKDRIILSITNKYLTRLFDNYFENCSYAFRSKENKNCTAILSHHDCIDEILEYRRLHSNIPLWIVECDMEKFYDTVNHKIALLLFKELIEQCKKSYPEGDFSKSSHIFTQFLECYAFNQNVPSPEDSQYWESYHIPNGCFKWVSEPLKELGYYDSLKTERIGIPQGGALSGLIANILLNLVDKVVLQTGVLYLRFCDDMIIIHPDKTTCEIAKGLYINTLQALKLIPHRFGTHAQLKVKRNNKKGIGKFTYAPFWKGKSKGPYKWGPINEDGFPWIGFVGYELHHDGHIRVRKKSLLKEQNKQKEVIEKIKNAVRHGMRKSKGSVTESAIHRLIGMSVGRVNLKNYNTISNDLCWKNGFKRLRPNRYSVLQIKQLDRNRNKLYYDFVRDLKESTPKTASKQRQIIHFNKPFSYYHQIIERNKYEKE